MNKWLKVTLLLSLLAGVVGYTTSSESEEYLDNVNCMVTRGYRTICDFETRKNYVMKCEQWANWVASATKIGPSRFYETVMQALQFEDNKKTVKYKWMFSFDAAAFAEEGEFTEPYQAKLAAMQECGLVGSG